MATHCQTLKQNRSSGVPGVLDFRSSFILGQKKGGGGQLQTDINVIGQITFELCLFSLYFVKCIIFFVWKAV